MRKTTAALIIFVFLAAVLTGCATAKETPAKLNIPEAEQIQNTLSTMSKAVINKDQSSYMQAFAEICLQRDEQADYFKYMTDRLKVGKYSQTLTKARRIYGGTVCTVQVYCESQANGKKSIQSTSREVYFISESGSWKIADYDYYPLVNPYIVAGSDSLLYDDASRMAEELSYKLIADKNHLETYGDTILIGTAYDNASILDLEKRGLTNISITEDYPGDDSGVVQVLTNIDNHRFVIIIQGSSSDSAKNAVEYMTRYLKQNPYINAGVYFIRDNKLKKAGTLELTTLTTLDPEKSESRLADVQKNIEANIAMLHEELAASQEQLLRREKNAHNPYLDDYYKAFMRDEQSDTSMAEGGMAAISANFTDRMPCTDAFSLPSGNDAGTIYSYSRFLSDHFLGREQPFIEAAGIFSSNASRRKTAGELYTYNDNSWKLSGDPYSIANFNTSMFRLLGFSQQEAYSLHLGGTAVNYLGINNGYIGISEGGAMRIDQKLSTEELKRIENDVYYIDFEHSTSNLAASDILNQLTSLNKVLKLKKEITRSKASAITVAEKERLRDTFMLYNTEDIYGMLKDAFLLSENTSYASLSEAKAELRSVMGQLLALKNTESIISAASAYPGSQFDYSRFAAGLCNVEYPNVYAQAAVKSNKIKEAAKNIKSSEKEQGDILQQLLQLSDNIETVMGNTDRFTYPDICLSNKSGTPMDKALILYGIYKNLYPDTADTYVAIGLNSSYLVFPDEYGWVYIDCGDNLQKSFISDDIYLCFNERSTYNSRLETGNKPDFIK